MKTLDKNIHDISIVSSIALSIIPVLSIGIIPPKPRTSAFLQLYDENMNHTANPFPVMTTGNSLCSNSTL